MVTIEYKILFEVRILHDYYLTDRLGKSFFSLEENAQAALLEEKLRKERYDIHADFELLLSHRDQAFFRNHKMKLVKTKLGFFVGMEVDAEKLEDGKLIYKPMIPLREDAGFKIGLGLKNQFFLNISNLPLVTNEDELLYFTNTGKKKKNILSQPIAKFKQGKKYQMGDLIIKNREIQIAKDKTSGGTKFWDSVLGNGYVHQADLFPIRQEPWFKDWLLDLETAKRTPFALLNISLKSDNPDLSPIKDNGYLNTEFLPTTTRPRHPVYELRFLGRSTYWRYKKAGGFSDAERNHIKGQTGEFLNFENGHFITQTPYFLSAERPHLGSNGFKLPSAKPHPIKFENDKLYSDIYFNNINPIQEMG